MSFQGKKVKGTTPSFDSRFKGSLLVWRAENPTQFKKLTFTIQSAVWHLRSQWINMNAITTSFLVI